MTDTETIPAAAPSNVPPTMPFGAWLVVVAALVTAAVIGHALLPRYDVRLIGADGRAVLIVDKWTGRLQRVDYGPDGQPVLRAVVAPF